jgi:flagellar protein FlaJ
MNYIDRKPQIAVLITSLFIGLTIFLYIFLQGLYIPELPYIIPLKQNVNNIFALAIMIIILPNALIQYNNITWERQVDKNIPRLLMDITESIQSGESLYNAVEASANRDYGPVNQHLENAVANFRMTSDFEESMRIIGKKLRRPNAKRLTTILIETHQTGGNIIDILDTSIIMLTSLDEYKEERDSYIGPYVLLVYVGALVFLVMSWTVITQFIEPIIEISQEEYATGATILRSNIEKNYYVAILFWASVIEGTFGGLVAGKIASGKMFTGLIHSVFLLALTLVFFNFFIA